MAARSVLLCASRARSLRAAAASARRRALEGHGELPEEVREAAAAALGELQQGGHEADVNALAALPHNPWGGGGGVEVAGGGAAQLQALVSVGADGCPPSPPPPPPLSH